LRMNRREERIRNWMLEAISKGGIERYDDLHIDQIDSQWKQRSTWVTAALTAYKVAVSVRETLRLSVSVALAFSLTDAEEDSAEAFQTVQEFERQLDWSPPSLYLFDAGDEKHLSATVHVNPLPAAITCQLPDGTKSCLLRWKTNEGTHRSVFVEAPRQVIVAKSSLH